MELKTTCWSEAEFANMDTLSDNMDSDRETKNEDLDLDPTNWPYQLTKAIESLEKTINLHCSLFMRSGMSFNQPRNRTNSVISTMDNMLLNEASVGRMKAVKVSWRWEITQVAGHIYMHTQEGCSRSSHFQRQKIARIGATWWRNTGGNNCCTRRSIFSVSGKRTSLERVLFALSLRKELCEDTHWSRKQNVQFASLEETLLWSTCGPLRSRLVPILLFWAWPFYLKQATRIFPFNHMSVNRKSSFGRACCTQHDKLAASWTMKREKPALASWKSSLSSPRSISPLTSVNFVVICLNLDVRQRQF